jgi:hypothetical protein
MIPEAITALLIAQFGKKIAVAMITALTVTQILTIGVLTGTFGAAVAGAYIVSVVGFIVWHCV